MKLRQMRNGLLYVSTEEYTVGFVVQRSIVTDAPNIARWARGKAVTRINAYYRNRGATIHWLSD